MQVETLPKRSQVLQVLDISDRTLRNYCSFLQKHAGKQFGYRKGQKAFDPHQFKALGWLAECRRAGWDDQQIVNHIIRNGIQ